MKPLIFLKLGGSLITDKDTPRTHRPEILARLAGEIAAALHQNSNLHLVIGHGSGSYGHTAASRHNTRAGVHSPTEWLGFAEVWKEARDLNQRVIEALLTAGLPVTAFPPSATLLAHDGRATAGELRPLQAALQAGLIPVVNGDTVFDEVRGGTILSTEDIFIFMAPVLQPQRILLAGIEECVWADFPACTRRLDLLTPAIFEAVSEGVTGSVSVDVTGGMHRKVQQMLALTSQLDGLQAEIFSGLQPGSLQQALLGRSTGTLLQAS